MMQEIIELPTLPSESVPDVLPGLPEIETQPLSETLPRLPSSPKTMSSEGIKHEISKPSTKLMPSINQKVPELTESKRTLELPDIHRPREKMTKKLEPVFIRLDKFQTTLETFEEIKSKIQEIEELLARTKEIKQKEEQELADWEREIQTIKARIDLIDKTIFNKLD